MVNDNKLLELVKSAAINFFGALVMALFILGGTYLLVNYANMEQVAAAGLVTLLATQVFSALPASAKGLATTFLEYLKTAIPLNKKTEDEGSSTPSILLAVGLVVVVIAAIITGAIFVLHINVYGILGAGAIAMAIAFLAGTGLIKPSAVEPVLPGWVSFQKYNGYVTAFVDVALWRKSTAFPAVLGMVKPENGDYYDIMAVQDGAQHPEPDCWVVLNNGVPIVCAIDDLDPFEGAMDPSSGTTVMNAMNALKLGADKLNYLMAMLKARGYDERLIKASLCMTPAQISALKYKPELWAAFLADTDPDVENRLSTRWNNFLTVGPEVSLVDKTDTVFNTYW